MFIGAITMVGFFYRKGWFKWINMASRVWWNLALTIPPNKTPINDCLITRLHSTLVLSSITSIRCSNGYYPFSLILLYTTKMLLCSSFLNCIFFYVEDKGLVNTIKGNMSERSGLVISWLAEFNLAISSKSK